MVCSACNLASPVLSGFLFEILSGRQPMSRYLPFLGALSTVYIVEPLLTRVYIQNVCTAGEKVRRKVSSPVHCASIGVPNRGHAWRACMTCAPW